MLHFRLLAANAAKPAAAAALKPACWCPSYCQVTGTLLKGYKARFKGAPLSSTVNYLKQYMAVSALALLCQSISERP